MVRVVQRVIVRRVDNLGDIVIALPTLQALRSNYPNAEMTLMVKDSHRVLCAGIADSFLPPASVEEFREIANGYDFAFNIEYFGPGNHTRQTFQPDAINLINAVPGPRRRPMARHLLDGVAALGLAIPRSDEPRFQISPELRKVVAAWLKSRGLLKNHRLWIGVHIGSSAKEKRWPLEKFTALAGWLWRTLDAHLFFFGSRMEAEYIQLIQGSLPSDCSDSIVDMSLDFVAGILARMDFLIGNDSGIGHLASAVRTPTISIFGPTVPSLWRPASTQCTVVHASKVKRRNSSGPSLSVEEVKQGVLLCIQQHLRREQYPILDLLRIAPRISITRVTNGVILQSGKRGPACLVTDGWRRVKQILAAVADNGSFEKTLEQFPDAAPLIALLILHRIILQGQTRRMINPIVERDAAFRIPSE